jgi:hypothetical protein
VHKVPLVIGVLLVNQGIKALVVNRAIKALRESRGL